VLCSWWGPIVILSQAYLKNGVPQNNLKKTSLLVKVKRKMLPLKTQWEGPATQSTYKFSFSFGWHMFQQTTGCLQNSRTQHQRRRHPEHCSWVQHTLPRTGMSKDAWLGPNPAESTMLLLYWLYASTHTGMLISASALLMQWLRTLLYPRIKSKVSKAGHEWRAFAVAQPEPLLRFALCSGSHSDPAVSNKLRRLWCHCTWVSS
jgi:hypothetical protein